MARKSLRRKARQEAEAVPDVYQEMLADATSSTTTQPAAEERPLKRRRTAAAAATTHSPSFQSVAVPPEAAPGKGRIQTAYQDSEDSDESDIDWEQIDLQEEAAGDEQEDERGGLDLVLNQSETSRKPTGVKRKPLTNQERQRRLDVHKSHVISLLAHVTIRNSWCNDADVQNRLRDILDDRIVSLLNPATNLIQFQRTRSLTEGLEKASESFRGRFKITARGLWKPRWADSPYDLENYKPPDDIEPPIELADFQGRARSLGGSRDVGAQLFCALLRSAGVETRLVCSLQPLPFSNNTPKPAQAKRPAAAAIQMPFGEEPPSTGGKDETRDGKPPSLVPLRARNLGAPEYISSRSIPVPAFNPPPKQKRIRESAYPVYWVEAFNLALQKWIAVDPLVTKTVAKPLKFEPPSTDHENSMSYVLAFEDDGVAHDVTRRYVKAYHAKTRRSRVESIQGGDKWWRKTMRVFRRAWQLDRDQVESAELAAKEAQEPMPKNVQDFKDHPYYALERHLRRNEVIHPRTVIGKVSAGKSSHSKKSKSLEPIFRRRDVKIVKSADGWYRLGREIKPGEQPLKRTAPRRQRQRSVDSADAMVSDDDTDNGTNLYAEYQTVLYEAPPIVNGRVPKNSWGNLDVYVPSMVPKGGVHIQDPEAARAARLIGVDYADAVTGFEFRGRHGTAVVRGAVVAADYAEAVAAVISGFRDEQARIDDLKKSLEALRLWKRFHAALVIHERIDGYEIEGERDAAFTEEAREEQDTGTSYFGGGFMPEASQEFIAEPTVGQFSGLEAAAIPAAIYGGGFIQEEADEKRYLPTEHAGGGGFLPEDEASEEVPPQNDIFPASPSLIYATSDRPAATAPSGAGSNELSAHDEAAQLYQAQQLFGHEILPGDEPVLQAERIDQERASSNRDSPEDTDMPTVGTVSEPPQTSPDVLQSSEPREAATEKTPQQNLEQSAGEDSDDEKGSLLSHDPEDDDADPEWLGSD